MKISNAKSSQVDNHNDGEDYGFICVIVGMCLGSLIAFLLFHFGILDGILSIGLSD